MIIQRASDAAFGIIHVSLMRSRAAFYIRLTQLLAISTLSTYLTLSALEAVRVDGLGQGYVFWERLFGLRVFSRLFTHFIKGRFNFLKMTSHI